MKNCHRALCTADGARHYWPTATRPLFFNPMINRINNAICLLVVAAVFAMIGIEAGNQAGATHSGTQSYIEVRK